MSTTGTMVLNAFFIAARMRKVRHLASTTIIDFLETETVNYHNVGNLTLQVSSI